MRVHEAQVIIACTYRRTPDEDDRGFPDPPDPWAGEWSIKDKAAVSVHDDAHECLIVYEGVLSVWEPNRAKAIERVEEWCKTLSWSETAPQRFVADRWNRKDISVVSCRITGTRKVSMAHSIGLPWSLLADPTLSMHGSSVKQRYNSVRIDIALQALHDLYVSAEGYDEDDRWVTWTTRGLLSGGCQEHGFGYGWKVAPVTSLDSIGRRFQYALMARGREASRRWKSENGITHDGAHVLSRAVPRETKEGTSASAIQTLMSMRGCRLGHQLNGMHPGARIITDFGIGLTGEGIVVMMSYGYQGSSWTQILASSRLGEPFMETLSRGARLANALVPDARQQVSDLAWKRRDEEREREYA